MAITLDVILNLFRKNNNVLDEVADEFDLISQAASQAGQEIDAGSEQAESALDDLLALLRLTDQEIRDISQNDVQIINPEDVAKLNKTFADLLPNLSKVEESLDRFQQLQDLGLDDSITDLKKFNEKLAELGELDDVGVENLRPQLEEFRAAFKRVTTGEGSVEDFKKALKSVDEAFEAEKLVAQTRKAEKGFEELKAQSGALGRAVDGIFGKETSDKLFRNLANLKNTFISANDEGNNFRDLLMSIQEASQIEGLDDLNGTISEFGGNLAKGNLSAETFGGALKGLATKALDLGKGLTGASAVVVGAVAVFALLATAVIGAGKALFDFASATTETFQQLNRVSIISGVAIEKLQLYTAALQLTGLNADALEEGLESLNDVIESGVISSERVAIGLNRVGISLAEIERATPTERLDLFVKALKGVQSEAERIDIAKAIGGETGGKTLNALVQGADFATEAFNKLDLTLTKGQQTSLKNFNQEVKFLQLAFESLFNFIGADAAGIFSDLAKQAREAFIELRQDPKVVEGFKNLFQTIEEIVFFTAETAIPVIKKAIEGIGEFSNIVGFLQDTLGAALAPIIQQAINLFELLARVLDGIASPVETVRSAIESLGVVLNNAVQGNFVPLEQKINSIIGGLKEFILTITGITPVMEGLAGTFNKVKDLSNNLLGTGFAIDSVTKSTEDLSSANLKLSKTYDTIRDTIATANRQIEETAFANAKLVSKLTEIQGERLLSVQRALDAGVVSESEAAERTRIINKETSDQIIKFKEEELVNTRKLLEIESRDRDAAIARRKKELEGEGKSQAEVNEILSRLRKEKETEVTDGLKKLAAAEDSLRQEQLKKEQQSLADRRAIQAAIFTQIQEGLEKQTKARAGQIEIELAQIEKAEELFTITATQAAKKRTEIKRTEIEKQINDLKAILEADDENTKQLIANAEESARNQRELTAGTLLAIDDAEKRGNLTKAEAAKAREEIVAQEKRAEIAALKEISEAAQLTEQQRKEIRKRLADLVIELNKQEIEAEKEKREALIKDLELQFEMQKALAEQSLAFAQRQLSDREKIVKQSVDVETAVRRGGIADINRLVQEQFQFEKDLLAKRNKLELDAINEQIKLQQERIKLNAEESKSPTEQIAAKTELIKLEQQRADIIAGQIRAEQDAKQALFDFEKAQRQALFDEYTAQLEQQGASEKQIAQATSEFRLVQINREIERIKEVIKARQAEGASAEELIGLETDLLDLISERSKAQKELNKLIEDQNKTFKDSIDLTTDYLNKLLGTNALFKSGADAFAEATKNNLEILKEFAAENDRLINEARQKFEEEQKKLAEQQAKAAEDLAKAQEQASKDREDAENKANQSLQELRKDHKEKIADIEEEIGDVQTKALEDQQKVREKAQADRDAIEQRANEKAKDRQEDFDNDQFEALQKQIERLRNLRVQAELDELNRQQDLVVKKSDLNKSLNDALSELDKARTGGDDKDIKAIQKKIDDIKKELGKLENEDVASKDRASRKKSEIDAAEAEFNKKKGEAKSKDDLDAAEKEFNAKVDTINKKFKNEEDFFKQLEQLRKNNDTKAIAELTELYNKEQALLDDNLKQQTAQIESQRKRKEDLRQAELKAEEEAIKKSLEMIDKKEKDEIAKIVAAAEEKIRILANRLEEENRLFKKAKEKIENELLNTLTAIEAMFGKATQAATAFFGSIVTGATAAGNAVGTLNLGGVPAGGTSTSTANPNTSSSSGSSVSSAGNVFTGGTNRVAATTGSSSNNQGLNKQKDDQDITKSSSSALTPSSDNDSNRVEIPKLDPKTLSEYEETCKALYKKYRGVKNDDLYITSLFNALQFLLVNNELEAKKEKPNPQIGQVDGNQLESLVKTGQVIGIAKSDKSLFEKATQDIIKLLDQALKLKGNQIPSSGGLGKGKTNPVESIQPLAAPITPAVLSNTGGSSAGSQGQTGQSPSFSLDIPERGNGTAIFPIKENLTLGQDVYHDMVEIYHYYIGNFREGDPVALANFAIKYIDELVKTQKISADIASTLKQQFTGKLEGSLVGKEEAFGVLLKELLDKDGKSKGDVKGNIPVGGNVTGITPTDQTGVLNSQSKTPQGQPSSGNPPGGSGQTGQTGQTGNTGINGLKEQQLKELGDLVMELYETVTLDMADKPLNLLITKALSNKLITLGQGKNIRSSFFTAKDSKALADSLTKILGVTITSKETGSADGDGDQGASPTTGKDQNGDPTSVNKSLSAVGAGGANRGIGDGGASGGVNGKDGKDGGSEGEVIGGDTYYFYNTFEISVGTSPDSKQLVMEMATKTAEIIKNQQKNQLKGQLGARAITK